MRTIVVATACFTTFASAIACAQKPPVIRQIGRLERASTESLESVSAALPTRDGRVLVNDGRARRLLIFDSTLAHPKVIADTTSATANAYGRNAGVLFRYRGDTALLVDQQTFTMLVIGPTGAIVRVMAFPPPPDSRGGVSMSGPNGTPAFDARGRLVFVPSGGAAAGITTLRLGTPILADGKPTEMGEQIKRRNIDSTFILRVDLATRSFDTVASLRGTKFLRLPKTDAQGQLTAIENTLDPLPVVDDWAVMADGSIAVVRSRDYHVDWIAVDGSRSSSPKMPFDWQRVSDARKQALIDSMVPVWQERYDRNGDPNGGGRGRGTPIGARPAAPNVVVRPTSSDFPEYVPPFERSPVYPVHADTQNNLWIRTTTIVGGQPVYDIVNRRGELFDRVQLPSFRTIAGFGPGVVYMAVKDSAGHVHLERARIK